MINHSPEIIQLGFYSHSATSSAQKAIEKNKCEAKQIPQTLNAEPDFIKRFHINSTQSVSNHDSKFIALYEDQFKVRVGSINNYQKISSLKENDTKMVEQQNDSAVSMFCQDLHFQTVPYDARFISTNPYPDQPSLNIIVSNKSMPVRIYQLDSKNLNQPQPHSLSYCTFHEHKPNSQAFLSPHQFSVRNKRVVGAGKRFFSIYDCQKIQSSRLKAFDRIQLSTVQLLPDQNTVLIGDFVGNIYQIDLRQQNKTLNGPPLKAHVDAVFHTISFESDENMFVSSARKDNFTYLFDRRNLSTFVTFYEFERHSNQRYGLATKGDTFAIGSQDGSIYLNSIGASLEQGEKNGVFYQGASLEQGEKNGVLYQDPWGVNVSDVEIVAGKQKIEVFYSVGTRFYSQIEGQNEVQDSEKSRQNFGLSYFEHLR